MHMYRIDAVKAATGHPSATSIYEAIKAGAFPEPVAIGARAVAWPDYEVNAMNAARISEKTPDEIKALVSKLHANRKGALDVVMRGQAGA